MLQEENHATVKSCVLLMWEELWTACQRGAAVCNVEEKNAKCFGYITTESLEGANESQS